MLSWGDRPECVGFAISEEVIGCWLLVIGYWLLVIGYWLLVIGYWLLVIGYWLVVQLTYFCPGYPPKSPFLRGTLRAFLSPPF
ncbi:MAG: hypothetical protein ABI262_21605 [Microcoleus sp.]